MVRKYVIGIYVKLTRTLGCVDLRLAGSSLVGPGLVGPGLVGSRLVSPGLVGPRRVVLRHVDSRLVKPWLFETLFVGSLLVEPGLGNSILICSGWLAHVGIGFIAGSMYAIPCVRRGRGLMAVRLLIAGCTLSSMFEWWRLGYIVDDRVCPRVFYCRTVARWLSWRGRYGDLGGYSKAAIVTGEMWAE